MGCRECDALRAEIEEWERRYDEYTVQRAETDRVARWQRCLSLYPAHAKLIIAIVDEPDRVVSIDRLMSAVGGSGDALHSILKVYMVKIRNEIQRRGLPRKSIRAVHARGYTVTEDAARQIKALAGE